MPAPLPGRLAFEPGFVHACAAMALALGILTRLTYFVHIDFPLNDGGLFLAMADAIRAAGFTLPETVAYNGHALPFAYPPLSFFLTAAIARVSGLETLTVQIYLPLVFNLLSIVLFVHVAARLTDDRAMLFFASAAMPLIPRSYEWLIMGGGVSRSPGMFLSLVALALSLRIVDAEDPARRMRWAVACTIASGLTLATHLEWGITSWVGTAIVLLGAERSRRQLALVVAIGFGMGLVSAPWWATVLARHGLDPFLAASATSGWEGPTFFDRVRNFDLFTRRGSWIGVLGGIGFAIAIAKGRLLAVAWLLAIWLTTPRHGATAAVMPVSLLIGRAMSTISDRLARSMDGAWTARSGMPESTPGTARLPLVRTIAFVALFGCIAADTAEFQRTDSLAALSAEERAGMTWIRDHTEPGDRFLVVSSATHWAIDRTAEWFPLLAARTSANTPQGLEWVHDGSFDAIRKRGDVLRMIVNTSPSTAPAVGHKIFGGEYTHVAVFAEPGSPVFASYDLSPGYELVHGQPHLNVYRLRPVQVSDAGAPGR